MAATGYSRTGEFKLVFADQSMAEVVFETLTRRQSLGQFRLTPAEQQSFEDVYYDTADRLLSARKTSLRIRTGSTADRSMAVVHFKKRLASPGRLDYATVAQPVPAGCNGSGQCMEIPAELSATLMLEVGGAKLGRIGTISTHRRVVKVSRNGEHIGQIYLDRFTPSLQAPDSAGRVMCECHEVEVKSANASELEHLGQSLCNWFGMIRVTSSKLERHLPARCSGISRLLLDMDPGVDDALAILNAVLGEENVSIEGITAVGGNASVKTCAQNAYRVCRWLQSQEHLPAMPRIGAGVDLAEQRNDATNVHGLDGLGDIDWGEISGEAQVVNFEDAVELQKEILLRYPGEVAVVATGPCSNLGQLIRRYPNALRNAREVIVMGGVFFDCGNRSPGAEFNIHSDAAAARVLLEYCRQPAVDERGMLRPTVPLTFVGLDVTHRVILERARLADARGKAGKLALDFTRKYMNFYHSILGVHGCPLHDPLAVAAALHPEYLVCEPYHVEIVSTPSVQETDGVTIADSRPAVMFRDRLKELTNVCVSVDAKAFLNDFLSRVG